ncbi:MAG: hypothetical protein SVR94_10890, partial [Pseudomonadota bacterium]|nr:hypothetical protein [Pseudomonadota bacterium]
MQLKQRLEHIEADLFNTDKGYSTRCQLIAEQANQLVFSPEILVDLSPHALTPCISLSAKASTYYALEAAIPLLRGKIVQWRLHIQPSCSTLFFKLGSGGRINNCDLILSIFQQQVHQLQLVATSQIAGHQVQDNQWSAFSFTQPLPPGDYIGQLSSPNADNQNNTLFLWLTVELTHTILMPSGELLDLYRYGLQPVISLSATTPMDAHISVPLLQHYTLQWYWDLSQETTVLSHCFLKLGTQGKVNHCHLVLSFFAEQQDCFHLVTTAYLDGVQAQDGQWSQLNFEHPLPPNNYLCRLQSPDSDNTDNTLFIWLTTYGSPYYCYLPLPVASLETELAQLQKLPLITLLMVIPTQSHYWQQCLESIVNQSYPYWQLCIVSEHTHPELQAYQHHFGKQIILMTEAQPRNPYQTALTSAQGEYVALVHPDDLLSVNALLEIVKYINQATQPVDMLYSDEDKVNQSGLLDEPYFK